MNNFHNKNPEQPLIYLAFRFHGNFYHSYRGDTPDELGFGKDIRIVSHIISELDRFNERGIPVQGTWDFENYFSLETIMPEHCPDLIGDLQRRVNSGVDEIEIMSYNNGLISCHTQEEFDAAIGSAIHNERGSGVGDLFSRWSPIVRPQEMMFTPGHLRAYTNHGIKAVSLYYSALPFNGFSTFVRPLGLPQRYNPLTLEYPGIEQTMTLLPAYNPGDVIDNLSLRGWLKRMRKEQLKLDEPRDLLLLIDMDADDEFWVSLGGPVVSAIYPTAGGIRGLVESVLDLPWLRFTTPEKYLNNHPPVGTLSFGQDTADGSFDGISSWAEKYSSHELWTIVERCRLKSTQVKAILEYQRVQNPGSPTAGDQSHILALLDQAFQLRLRVLSTTHFGMASPVMNLPRLNTARKTLEQCTQLVNRAMDLALEREEYQKSQEGKSRNNKTSQSPESPIQSRTVLEFSRKELGGTALSNHDNHTEQNPGNRLHSIVLENSVKEKPTNEMGNSKGLKTWASQPLAGWVQTEASTGIGSKPGSVPKSKPGSDRGSEFDGNPGPESQRDPNLVPAFLFPGTEKNKPRLLFSTSPTGQVTWNTREFLPISPRAFDQPTTGFRSKSRSNLPNPRETGPWQVSFNGKQGLLITGDPSGLLTEPLVFTSWITYNGKRFTITSWNSDGMVYHPGGNLSWVRTEGRLELPKASGATEGLVVTREFLFSSNLPYFLVTTGVTYPQTIHRGYDIKKALRLGQTWDNRWQEIAPCEISFPLDGQSKAEIWKHSPLGDISSYNPDYSGFSRNYTLDSINNHLTPSWIGVSNTQTGLFLSQNPEFSSSMAFCPMRTRISQDASKPSRLFLNPFGTYSGKQYSYPTAYSGLGKFAAVQMSASDHVKPYGPSFNGVNQEFQLLVAPYRGNCPPESLRAAGEAHSYSPIYLSR